MHACYIITADAQDPRLLFALEIENTGWRIGCHGTAVRNPATRSAIKLCQWCSLFRWPTMHRLASTAAAVAGGLAAVGLATRYNQLSTAAGPAHADAPSTPAAAGAALHPRWQKGWEAGRYSEAGIGFHHAAPNPHLLAFEELLLPARRVLVPLCGKSVDLPYLASKGAAVVGVEGVARAVREFTTEQSQLTAAPPSTLGDFTVHPFHGLHGALRPRPCAPFYTAFP